MKHAALVASLVSMLLAAVGLVFVREGLLAVTLLFLITACGGFAVVSGNRAWRRREAEGLIAVIMGNVGLWAVAVWLFLWLRTYPWVE